MDLVTCEVTTPNCPRKKCWEGPTPEELEGSQRFKGFYSTTYGINYRHPEYPSLQNKDAIEKLFQERFDAYKKEADAKDAANEPKFVPPRPKPGMPEEWWARDEDPEVEKCKKELVRKYMWSTTYREMNKDGAALPVTVQEKPSSIPFYEKPIPRRSGKSGDSNPDDKLKTLLHFPEEWDRPEVELMARKRDTIANNPCLERDPYFKTQHLNRSEFAKQANVFEYPSEENLALAREDKLRMPYNIMTPGYGGYRMREAPPIPKAKSEDLNSLSMQQASYVKHPEEFYKNPTKSIKKEINDLMEKYQLPLTASPVNTLGQMPLPPARRLAC